MTAAFLLFSILSAPVPPDLLMLQDTLDLHYDNVFLELYSCPIPSVDHYGAVEMDWLTEDPLSPDDWFVIGDTLVSREIDTSMFLFKPESDSEAAETAAWLASARYCHCRILSVNVIPEPDGYTIPVSLTVYHSPPMMGDADSALVLHVYTVTGDNWHMEVQEADSIP
ncbi:MAG: hypothetical protein JXA64_05410 [Candidatus Fermentibacteraceae bacterium]|nr:hypothetical protein [Candidatus Fermentibacteraceae bacterium]MBN2608533.1 hypothetical protein [Candidatus Fermentibacteraceae bacterium]